MSWLMRKEIRVAIIALMAASFVMALNTAVYAITAPTSGSFAYDVYDIGVNKILKGPIGFVGGVAAIGVGVLAAMRSMIMMAISAVICAAVLLKADSLVESLGAIV